VQTVTPGEQGDDDVVRADHGQEVTITYEGKILQADDDESPQIVDPKKTVTFMIGEGDVSGVPVGENIISILFFIAI